MSTASNIDHQEEITLTDLQLFPDDNTAEKWFETNIWQDGRVCPDCKYKHTIKAKHPKMPYYCSRCKSYFSVKKGTIMQQSKIGYRKWAIAVYQFMINAKGVSSMKLHRDLGITQKSAWFMVQRLKKSWRTLAGPSQTVESLARLKKHTPQTHQEMDN